MSWSIGLDGVYRFSPGLDGRSLALRGNWSDPQIFFLEYNGITTNDHMVLQFRFEGDRAEVTVSETAGGPGAEFEGQLQQP